MVDCLLYHAAVDLIEKLIDLDPMKRLTAEQTLAHPYLSGYHDPTDEPTYQGPPVSSKYPVVYSANDLGISKWKGNSTSLFYTLSETSLVVSMLHTVLCSDVWNSM